MESTGRHLAPRIDSPMLPPDKCDDVREEGMKSSGSRIAVVEIADRLSIGRMAVYQLLENRIIPAVRLGRRWIVTRYAYEQWEKTCGCTSYVSSAKIDVS